MLDGVLMKRNLLLLQVVVVFAFVTLMKIMIGGYQNISKNMNQLFLVLNGIQAMF